MMAGPTHESTQYIAQFVHIMTRQSTATPAAMNTVAEATVQALGLVATADPKLVGIVLLSLRVSLAAVVLGCLIGLPLGAAIAVNEFRGRRALIVILNGLMGLPSVVVGLVVYLLLSRAGPLGSWGILFTPTAMVIAQTILITPTIAALSRQIVADAWQEYREQLRSLGETRLGAATTLLWDLRFSLVTIVLAGLRARGVRGGRGDDRRRQHRRRDARDDDDDRAGDEQGRSAARARARHHPAVDRARPQCRRLRRQGNGAAAVRVTGAMDMRAPLSLLPLRLDDVEFEVGARRIIQGVSATLEAGPRTVILGPNGAGKSVLLRLCHGLLAPTAGTIEWNSPELPGGPRRQAMVFQRPVLLRRTALGNVMYALKLAGVPARQREERALGGAAQGRARRAGGPCRRACCPAASSSGSRWRACGRCVRRSSSSTSRRRASIRARRTRSRSIIRALHAAGTKIVMVTHNLGQAHRLGDEILFLHQGRLVERAPADRFLKHPASPEAASFLEGELPW